ncbi:unnamed protein product [Cyclocybe aegerita]|uniref:F-box domain-containing protein n=1 Tax=Cyclocybe aegerita TaxID=1973307 RepID=A0A8S0W092_CYCAE|nr:unnamed protein product [Cyclocybe aegerita]
MVAPSSAVESRSSSVRNLNDDLLLYIFMANANMDGDPIEYEGRIKDIPCALTYTRNTSHVCRLWRQTILASTSLWGRLINIGYLILLKEEWKWEILRRTSASLLHVKGTQTGYSPDFFLLLRHILDIHWERIETFEISAYFESTWEGDFWDPIARPSEVLKTFRVSLGDLEQPLQPGETLFGNDAPKLRELQLIGTIYLRANLDLSSSWFSQICHLDVSGSIFAPRPTLLAWLERLGGMPQLRTLTLTSPFRPVRQDPMPLPVGRLPNLTDLEVKHDTYSAALFLNHIETPPACRLRIDTSGIFTTVEFPARSHLIGEVLSKYSKRWFSANTTSTNLNLKINRQGFSVSQVERNSSGSRAAGCQDRMEFEVCIDVDYNIAFTELLSYVNIFSQCDLSRIAMLTTYLDISPQTVASPHLRKFISDFIRALPNVQGLITSMEVIAHLTKIPQGAGLSPVFPALQVLVLYDASVFWGDNGSVGSNRGREVGEAFFQLRQEEKHPIRVLDLTSCSALHDMSYLESAEGMKVSWIDDGGNRREEVCGYGRVAEGLGR